MKPITNADIGGLIQQTPDTPENQPLLAQLHALYQQSANMEKFYVYNAIFLALAIGVPTQQTINVDAAGDFVCMRMACHTDIGGVAQEVSTYNYPNVTCTISDTGSNQQWMDQDTPLMNIFGDGRWAFDLPAPRYIKAQSGIVVNLTSQEAANTPNIRLSFIGVKIYSLSGA